MQQIFDTHFRHDFSSALTLRESPAMRAVAAVTENARSLTRSIARVDRLHVFTTVDIDTELPSLAAFVRHYTALGVPSRQIQVTFHSSSSAEVDLPALKQQMVMAGLPRPKAFGGAQKAGAIWRHIMRFQNKRAAMSDWVIWAGIEDRLHFPDGLAATLDQVAQAGADWLQDHQRVLLHRAILFPDKNGHRIDMARSADNARRIAAERGYDLDTPSHSRAQRLARIAKRDSRGVQAQLAPDEGVFRETPSAPTQLNESTDALMLAPRKSASPALARAHDLCNSKVVAAPGWHLRQLTPGGFGASWHAHSYYDIPVIAPSADKAVVYRSSTPMRPVRAEDTVQVGLVDLDRGGFEPVAATRAWSWQQGPMAHWSTRGELVWNDREGDQFIGCAMDLQGRSTTRTYDRPIYALTPDGDGYFSLCWARLARVRPAYGYAGGCESRPDDLAPKDEGLWHVDFATGRDTLVLSIARAVECLYQVLPPHEVQSHRRSGATYWMNHVKLNPSGTRLTVKLRWREPGEEFDGVSLTCDIDGSNPHVLARASSHVMWYDDTRLYWWSMRGKEVVFGDDVSLASGLEPQPFAPGVFNRNPHARMVPGQAGKLVFDAPYTATVKLFTHDFATDTTRDVASFSGHVPSQGPYRCDLHPVPSPCGERILVTSLASGSRQVWLAERG